MLSTMMPKKIRVNLDCFMVMTPLLFESTILFKFYKFLCLGATDEKPYYYLHEFLSHMICQSLTLP